MKRAGPPTGAAGGGASKAPAYGGPRKPRGGDSDDDFGASQNSFEDDLMAMDEFLDDQQLLMDMDDSPAAQEKRWARPSVEGFDPKTVDLAFQWLDIDVCSEDILPSNPSGGPCVGCRSNPKAPAVRLYGVTQDGKSVLAYAHGFTPYFYVALPPSADLTDGALMNLRKALDQKVCMACAVLRHTTVVQHQPLPPRQTQFRFLTSAPPCTPR